MTNQSNDNLFKQILELTTSGNPSLQDLSQLLLKHKADVNQQDSMGQSLLHIAAYDGHIKVIELLLKYGACVNLKDPFGFPPLYRAVVQMDIKIVKLLLEYKADPNVQINGCVPLHRAIEGRRVNVIQLLLEYKADPNRQDRHKRSPLHYAVESDHASTIEVLLKNKPDMTQRDTKDKTPFLLAFEKGKLRAVNCLIKFYKMERENSIDQYIDQKDRPRLRYYGEPLSSLAEKMSKMKKARECLLILLFSEKCWVKTKQPIPIEIILQIANEVAKAFSSTWCGARAADYHDILSNTSSPLSRFLKQHFPLKEVAIETPPQEEVTIEPPQHSCLTM